MYTAVECFDQREQLRWAQWQKYGTGKERRFLNNGSATISCTESLRTAVVKAQKISEGKYEVVAFSKI